MARRVVPVMPADLTADEIGAPPAVAVRLSDPAKVAHLMLVAALTSYDPGTEPWTVLHNAADEVRAAMEGR